MNGQKSEMALYIALATAWLALAGSIFISESLRIPICILCWYQRILMFPLSVIIPVGMITRDRFLPWYVLPLSLGGFLVAVYHNLLQWHIIPETLAPCSLGVSCVDRYTVWGDFLTPPLLSMSAFGLISVCFLILIYQRKHEQNLG